MISTYKRFLEDNTKQTPNISVHGLEYNDMKKLTWMTNKLELMG